MMTCMYNKNLILQILYHRGSNEEKNLNLIIIDGQDALTIKLRDPAEFTFNYSENIDLGDYEVIRVKQNLDINFAEFKSNLLEMLTQLHNKEMFLKCEIKDQLCTLIFFNKSKIKSIIYLTLELHAASQKEIITEMMSHLQFVKDSNERLQFQVSCLKKNVGDKDTEIKQLYHLKNNMERQFYRIVKEMEDNINIKSKEVEYLLLRKIKVISARLLRILEDINTLRKASALKTDSNTRLVQNIENLRLENIEKCSLIEQLQKDNSVLQTSKMNVEKSLSSLKHVLGEKETKLLELQNKNKELHIDLEKAIIVLSQKSNTIDELSKDLLQANQMLVNFNHHYDTKVKELDDLQCIVNNNNKKIEEEKTKYYDIHTEFKEYKTLFNQENQEKLQHDLILAQHKIDDLEKSLRKANKINALLSEKVNKITR